MSSTYRTFADGAGRYVAPEVSDWLKRLEHELPPAAARADGTQMDRHDLISQISEQFAHHMSTGPDYSRSVTEHVQDAVRRFAKGNADWAGEAILAARADVKAMADAIAPASSS